MSASRRTSSASADRPPLPAALPHGPVEDAWIEVVRKMEEVYSELLQYEVTLEEKNAALEETQHFLFSVLTSMSDVLVVCDRKGAIQQVNHALSELVGRSEAALRGSPLAELFADADSAARAQQYLKTPQPDALHDWELSFRARDGSATPVAVNCTPRRSANGRFVGVVIAGRPVGELRRAYEQLRQAHEHLKQTQAQLVHSEKMASLGRLVAGVAHELNNPISFVLGNVHALKRHLARILRYLQAVHDGAPALEALRRELRIDFITDDLKPLLDGTVEGAERTRDIVAGLRRFSAMDRSEAETFDLADMLERSVHWVVRASGSPIAVSVEAPRPLWIAGAPGQLQQVVVNLVQNAIDATESQAGPRLEIDAHLDGERVVVRFRDNGPGIAPGDLAHIFDPFFTSKPVGKGTGLGLSISYGIVERHGGSLAASNRAGGGAEMTLELPLRPAPAP